MTLCFEKLDEGELNVVLRDLSSHENLDVKELFASYKKEEHERNKKTKSKADLIKEQNTKRLAGADISRDKERLEYFEDLVNIDSSTLDEIKHFITKYGKDRMKMKLLNISNLCANLLDVDPSSIGEQSSISPLRPSLSLSHQRSDSEF